MRGRENGLDHPLWEDGTPILVGQQVRYHDDDGIFSAIVHAIRCDEIVVGGMTADDEDWELEVGADQLERRPDLTVAAASFDGGGA